MTLVQKLEQAAADTRDREYGIWLRDAREAAEETSKFLEPSLLFFASKYPERRETNLMVVEDPAWFGLDESFMQLPLGPEVDIDPDACLAEFKELTEHCIELGLTPFLFVLDQHDYVDGYQVHICRSEYGGHGPIISISRSDKPRTLVFGVSW